MLWPGQCLKSIASEALCLSSSRQQQLSDTQPGMSLWFMALSDTSLMPLLFLIFLCSHFLPPPSLCLMMSFPFVWEGQRWCHHSKTQPKVRRHSSPLAQWTSLYRSRWIALPWDSLLSHFMKNRQMCGSTVVREMTWLLLSYEKRFFKVCAATPVLSFLIPSSSKPLSNDPYPDFPAFHVFSSLWLRNQSCSKHWLH